jgi:cytochrome bd-type quinol oxidase subunit 2
MIVVAIIFIVLGVLIKHGKMYFLIAGYNTMPKEEKTKYNIEGIATVFRNSMFGMGLIIIIGHFTAKWLEDPQVEIISLIVSIIIGIPYLLIKSNSDKYKIKNN